MFLLLVLDVLLCTMHVLLLVIYRAGNVGHVMVRMTFSQTFLRCFPGMGSLADQWISSW